MQPVNDGVLQVEPTDLCNLSCRMCAPHHEGWETIHGIPKGHLDVALWGRIVDGLVADGCHFDHIIFQWLGEPTVHPELESLVLTAATKLKDRVGYLRIDTNGILLTPERSARLLDGLAALGEGAPPLLLVFTLDAHSPATYTQVKGQPALERVRRHIRALVRHRRARGPGCKVNIQVQFVVQPGNGHEAKDFLHHWADLLNCQGGEGWHDEILFKRLSVGGGATGQAAADALYEQTLADAGIAAGKRGHVDVLTWADRPWQEDDGHRGERGPCPALWLTPVIRHDGELLLCCADLHSEMGLGSLDRHGFRELWDGPKATAHRIAHLDGRFEGPCAGCGGINWYETTPAMAAQARARDRELSA
jgi:MoaA/NifB/PqqE/SkfB family radical SAM enzyme